MLWAGYRYTQIRRFNYNIIVIIIIDLHHFRWMHVKEQPLGFASVQRCVYMVEVIVEEHPNI